MTLPDDAVAWIEQQCGGRVVDIEQQVRWRTQHFLTIERPSGTMRLLARSARQGMAAGSTFLQHFDIAHEARVLEALQDQGLKVPKFYGYHPEHRFILMERVDGTNELKDAPHDATRDQVMAEYIEQLATLHRLDVESMKLSGLTIPATPEETAFGAKFGFVEADFGVWKQHLKPEPLLELGIWWLHANVPTGQRQVAFVQGDTGPGQFMFAEGHLTALIDWELSHIGDPMLDLGVIRMRNMLYPTGSLRGPIARYEKISGRPLDWQALCFYTVMSMLLTPIGVSIIMQRPSALIEPAFPSFGWNATLRRGLTDALAEANGIEIEPPQLP
ncbi:MAG TPA: phosphotransferase family protein, partial [Mycobacterium sp.]